MFWSVSSLEQKNMHFVSCSAGGAEGDPVGLGELRPLQLHDLGLEESLRSFAARMSSPATTVVAVSIRLTPSAARFFNK